MLAEVISLTDCVTFLDIGEVVCLVNALIALAALSILSICGFSASLVNEGIFAVKLDAP
jgi:hypothetical protein